MAYSGIADAYSLIGYYGGLPPRQAYGNAKANALLALEIDDELAEPHTFACLPDAGILTGISGGGGEENIAVPST